VLIAERCMLHIQAFIAIPIYNRRGEQVGGHDE
jgi:hypothetical protein